MGKPHPWNFGSALLRDVEQQATRIILAAARFDVSVKFVNEMVKLAGPSGHHTQAQAMAVSKLGRRRLGAHADGTRG